MEAVPMNCLVALSTNSDLKYTQISFQKEMACFPVKHRGKWVLGIVVENCE